MRLKAVLLNLLIFVGFALWFAVLIPWTGFADPDAFYHAKAANLIWQNGPIEAFPWLDLTLLGSHYADLHFSLHAITAPLTALFGMFDGLRIMMVFLSTIFVFSFAYSLRWLGIRYVWLWAVLLAVTHPLVFRMLLGKATPLALFLFIVGLVAAWKRKFWIVFLLTAIYALSHGGWLYLAGSVTLLAVGDILFNRIVLGLAWREAMRQFLWKEAVLAYVGGLVGLFLHPNFPEVFQFAWTQIFTIGIGTPWQHVVMGSEWLPSEPSKLVASLGIWIAVLLIGFGALLLAPRKPVEKEKAAFVISVGLIVAVLVALTLKSRRNLEFLVPVTALWAAAIWDLADMRKFFRDTVASTQMFGRIYSRVILSIAVVSLLALVSKNVLTLWRDFHPVTYPDDIYAETMQTISERALPGDRVFHTSWDEFPMLFALDDRLKYVSGLDPTFLYVASTTLSDDVKNVTWDFATVSSTKEQVWDLVSKKTGSSFVFASKENHRFFIDLIKSDERYVQLAEDEESVVFEVMR
ncbi:MAG: hypothetical protein RDU25_06030 [Patescibacteria group bacterium]|nr:hypothetical protein [Patescibacteria group bacterium]